MLIPGRPCWPMQNHGHRPACHFTYIFLFPARHDIWDFHQELASATLLAVNLSSVGMPLIRRLFSLARCNRQMKHTCTDRSRNSSALAPIIAPPITSCTSNERPRHSNVDNDILTSTNALAYLTCDGTSMTAACLGVGELDIQRRGPCECSARCNFCQVIFPCTTSLRRSCAASVAAHAG